MLSSSDMLGGWDQLTQLHVCTKENSPPEEIPAYLNQWRKAFEGFHKEILFRKNLHLDVAALQTELYVAEPWAAAIEEGIRRHPTAQPPLPFWVSGDIYLFLDTVPMSLVACIPSALLSVA